MSPIEPLPDQSAREPMIPLSWFDSSQAREWVESCFDDWDSLTSAERQRYDGWIGGYILAVLAELIDPAEEVRNAA